MENINTNTAEFFQNSRKTTKIVGFIGVTCNLFHVYKLANFFLT